MLELSLYLLAALLMIGGLAGAILPALPGIPMIFGGIWLAAAVDGYRHVGLWWLVGIGLLGAAGVVVDFVAGATQADHTRVWQECQHLPNIDPEPLVTTSKYASTLRYNVRYRVDHASNYQLEQLYDCLAKDKSVAGTTSSGSDDES